MKKDRSRRRFIRTGACATALGAFSSGCFFPRQKGLMPVDLLGQAEPRKITIEDINVERFDEIKDNWV